MRCAWAMVLLGLSCGPEVPAPALQREAIFGGELDTGDPAVVSLVVSDSTPPASLCAGTLIGPKTVLTAAQCLSPMPYPLEVAFGSNAMAPQRRIAIDSFVIHPQYAAGAGTWSYDFALVALAAPASVSPVKLNERALTQANAVGLPVRYIGFGPPAFLSDPDGLKREATSHVRSVGAITFEGAGDGGRPCIGDSGGAAFMMLNGEPFERLAGVISYGDNQCTQDSFNGRVDLVSGWIRATMAGWETPGCGFDYACVTGCIPEDQDCLCVADGVCEPGCVTPADDPDCAADCGRNGVCVIDGCMSPDPDCLGTGDSCDAGVQCDSRRCVNNGQRASAYCSEECAGDTECPSTMVCEAGLCSYPRVPDAQLGDACDPAADSCVDSVCGRLTSIGPRCLQPCTSSAQCGAGATCELGIDSGRYCKTSSASLPPATVPEASDTLGSAPSGCSTSPSIAMISLMLSLIRRRRISA